MCEGQRATAAPAAQRTAVREAEDEEEDTTLPSTTCSTTVTVRVVVVDELQNNQRTARSGFEGGTSPRSKVAVPNYDPGAKRDL